MTSSLQNLENNEAILLMYLAGELPSQDRAEVEQMLASDAGLRAELEILRQTQQLAFDALETLDGATRPAVPRIVALSQISQLIHEWIDLRRQPTVTSAVVRQPTPWRRISLSAAAALLVGYYVWAVYHPPGRSINPRDIAYRSDELYPGDSDEFGALPQARELSSREKVAILTNSLDDSASDETSNLHVAEVAAVMPIDSSDQNVTGAP
ncbi:MAG TPA: hypothetical protein VHX86_04105 [Tepidisphaeraceae bacterium]|jgi:hypothetical protein|nr:hypothetical protein [Tepidisphaeraceae bacterium]